MFYIYVSHNWYFVLNKESGVFYCHVMHWYLWFAMEPWIIPRSLLSQVNRDTNFLGSTVHRHICVISADLYRYEICLNSVWPSDVIWRHRSVSTLAQLMAQNHYLDQCWLNISEVQWHSLRAISQGIPQPYIYEINLKITLVLFPANCLGQSLPLVCSLADLIYNTQGAVSIRKTVLPGMAIPMLKIRRPNGRLIFNMEIAIRR